MDHETQGQTASRPDVENLLEELRLAAFVVQTQDKFLGLIHACRTMTKFIQGSGGGAEVAGVFIQLEDALEFARKGGKPRLFEPPSKSTRKRSRSPEAKKYRRLASVFLHVLVKTGDSLLVAAEKVARRVKSWPGMQDVNATTVIAWRKTFSQEEKFLELCQRTLAENDPRKTVDHFLLVGPPSAFHEPSSRRN